MFMASARDSRLTFRLLRAFPKSQNEDGSADFWEAVTNMRAHLVKRRGWASALDQTFAAKVGSGDPLHDCRTSGIRCLGQDEQCQISLLRKGRSGVPAEHGTLCDRRILDDPFSLHLATLIQLIRSFATLRRSLH